MLLSRLYYYREKKVIILGLDSSGKSTILNQLLKYPKKKANKEPYMPPTLGFNMQKTTFKNKRYSFWDLSGNYNIRKYWKCYFTGCNGVIFVIDATDVGRVEENLEALEKLIYDEELKTLPFLIFLNKFDKKPNIDALSKKIELLFLKKKFKICKSTYKEESTIYAGFAWLAYEIK